MKGEINRDWYCSGYANDPCPDKGNCSGCLNYHRKHPTPEQFKEEYGEEWKGAVYFFYRDTSIYACATSFDAIQELASNEKSIPVICACTPWGKPPAAWRPE